jgi:hypothetical protein
MQSIFSPAARRQDAKLRRGVRRRDGGLKMDRTKPLPDASPIAIESRSKMKRRHDGYKRRGEEGGHSAPTQQVMRHHEHRNVLWRVDVRRRSSSQRHDARVVAYTW